tara:strand:- start:301 stop:519 length:219 start_codon:yes stop_codon:yes gene_type:complete
MIYILIYSIYLLFVLALTDCDKTKLAKVIQINKLGNYILRQLSGQVVPDRETVLFFKAPGVLIDFVGKISKI